MQLRRAPSPSRGPTLAAIAIALLLVGWAHPLPYVTVAAPSCVGGVRIDWIRSEGRRAEGSGVDVATGGGAVYLLSIQAPPTIKHTVATVSKYGAGGKRQWIVTIPGNRKRSIGNARMVVGSDGRIYVVGSIAHPRHPVFVDVLTPAGEVIAHRHMGYRESQPLIAAAPDASVYVVLHEELRRYWPEDPRRSWGKHLNLPTAIATDPAGGLYVGGFGGIARYDPRALDWKDNPVNHDPRVALDRVYDVAVSGDRVFAVYRWITEGHYIGWARYTLDGTREWATMDEFHAPFSVAAGITGGADGFGWVVGHDYRRGILDVLDRDGRLVGSRLVGDTSRDRRTEMTAVAPGETGAVYASGRSTEKTLAGVALGGQSILMRLSRCSPPAASDADAIDGGEGNDEASGGPRHDFIEGGVEASSWCRSLPAPGLRGG